MATTMKLIAQTTLGSSASNIEFTNIPATPYADLLLVCSLRDTATASGIAREQAFFTFNGSSTGYSGRWLFGAGTSTVSSGTSGTSSFDAWRISSANATSSTFTSVMFYIPNYAGSTNKSFSMEAAAENNSSSDWILSAGAGLWSNTAAITSVKVAPTQNFAANSSAFLYGITKA